MIVGARCCIIDRGAPVHSTDTYTQWGRHDPANHTVATMGTDHSFRIISGYTESISAVLYCIVFCVVHDESSSARENIPDAVLDWTVLYNIDIARIGALAAATNR